MDRDPAASIEERIRRFVGASAARAEAGGGLPSEAELTGIVREAFAFQVERIAPLRALAEARRVDPGAIADWREVPAVPALAYKSLDLLPEGLPAAVRGRVLTFRSSGTTAERRSVHRHPFPDLYRETIDAAFPRQVIRPPSSPRPSPLPRGEERAAPPVFSEAVGAVEAERLPMLSLVPSWRDLPDSSLSFMVDHVLERWGAPESARAIGPDGLDADAAAAWVRERPPDRPCLVLATALALAAWLDRLEEAETRLRLPPESVLFETGGFKGARRRVTRPELLDRVERSLGVPGERVVREYGMTELTSQLYTRVLEGGDPDLFVPPPWVRVRVLDPETLEEAREGAVGVIAILDPANVGSAIHLLTEDLGATEPGGLRLAGRARGAELRGCSLVAEELTGEAAAPR